MFHLRFRLERRTMIKVILVDDEDIIREGIGSFIDWKALGMELAGQAANGKEAMDLLQQIKPDIIITDVKMPKMNGLQLLEQAKKEKSNCIVIMISSYDEFEYAQNALNFGAYAYLLKPIDTDRLVELLKEAAKQLALNNSREELLVKARQLLNKPEEIRESGLSSTIYRAKKYIEDNYWKSDLRLEDVANYVYTNPSYFSTLFNKEMKISFGSFLTKTRMEKAIDLLKNSNMKIYEMAEKVGYQNVSWFTVAFKKYTGKSPGEYRKNY